MADMRRKDVGNEFIQRLIKHAKSRGYQRLVLETTETWQEAIGFY